MTDLYKIIGKFNDETSKKTEIIEDTVDEEEIKRITNLVTDKIRLENNSQIITISKKTSSNKLFRKRSLILAATLIMILAFGSIAYATDFFGLGKVNLGDHEFESPFEEGSNQYSASKEYNDYLNGLSEQKIDKLTNIELNKDLNESDNGKSQDISYTDPKKVKMLSQKYDLDMETRVTNTDSLEEAFAEAGMNNFIGSFDTLIDKNVEDYSEVFYYQDKGTVFFYYGNHGFTVIPSNVFPTADLWNWSEIETKKSNEKNWIYTTNDGNKVKCSYFQDEHLKHESHIYSFVYIGKDNTMIYHLEEFPAMVNKLTDKAQFEKLIDSLDLSGI